MLILVSPQTMLKVFSRATISLMTSSLHLSLISLRFPTNLTWPSFGLTFGTLKVGQILRKSSTDALMSEASLLLYEEPT